MKLIPIEEMTKEQKLAYEFANECYKAGSHGLVEVYEFFKAMHIIINE